MVLIVVVSAFSALLRYQATHRTVLERVKSVQLQFDLSEAVCGIVKTKMLRILLNVGFTDSHVELAHHTDSRVECMLFLIDFDSQGLQRLLLPNVFVDGCRLTLLVFLIGCLLTKQHFLGFLFHDLVIYKLYFFI